MPHAGVVALGGGHGLSRALAALRTLEVEPVAVVTVADDGGSSGRLRRDLGIIAPGDLRQALVTLARNRPLAELFAHRFERGELEGHAVGNLALVALAERAGEDFVAALDAACALLDCAGRVLPSTTRSVRLKARVAGEELDGQVRVSRARGQIERVWLEPDEPEACEAAVGALASARRVVLGPGSLFTSVIATLLVPGIRTALLAGQARVVYVANLTTQTGETTGFTADDHVTALVEHVPGLRLDAVVLHDGGLGPGPGEPLEPSLRHPAVERVVAADVVGRDENGAAGRNHDPDRLGRALAPLLGPAAP